MDIKSFIVREMEEKIENYYEKAIEDFSQVINEHKEMTICLLGRLQDQITLDAYPALLNKLQNDIYSCSKKEILEGW